MSPPVRRREVHNSIGYVQSQHNTHSPSTLRKALLPLMLRTFALFEAVCNAPQIRSDPVSLSARCRCCARASWLFALPFDVVVSLKIVMPEPLRKFFTATESRRSSAPAPSASKSNLAASTAGKDLPKTTGANSADLGIKLLTQGSHSILRVYLPMARGSCR